MVKKQKTSISQSLKTTSFSKSNLLIVVALFGIVGGAILYKSFAAPNPNLPGDLNNDNVVSQGDVTILAANFHTSYAGADVNTDGTVDFLDLSIILTNFGRTVTPAPTVTISASPSTISAGGSATITYSSTNASNCDASGAWSGTRSTAGGSESTGALNSTSSYTLTCSGPGGFGSGSATVTVGGGGVIPACTGVSVNINDDLQTLINNNPAGTSFCIKTGIHRMTSAVRPKGSDVFVGESGAVLSGAKDITSLFSASGSSWVASGQTQGGSDGNLESDQFNLKCVNQPVCRYDNDVYFDDLPLQRVTSLGSMGAGKFYFDYANDKIYIGNNPSGHKVEAGVAPQIVDGTTVFEDGVKFYNLTIEKAANSSQIGAIQGRRTWTFHNLEVRYNHGAGLGDGGDVMYNNVHHNGQMGIVGSDVGEFAFNEVAYNNYANYSQGWEAGGSKWAFAHDTYVHDNYFHDNDGNGIWYDGSLANNRIENNRVINNKYIGILYEISSSALIAGNEITGNGSAFINDTSIFSGAGIAIANSQDVDIHDNTLLDNRDGITLTEAAENRGIDTQNINVHDNSIHLPYVNGRHGLIVWNLDYSYFNSKNNRFQGNDYFIGCIAKPFVWATPGASGGDAGAFLTWAQWQVAGQDNNSSSHFTSTC